MRLIGKGGKNRKKAKNLGVEEKRELVFKEDGQEYGQVLRMLGKFTNLKREGTRRENSEISVRAICLSKKLLVSNSFSKSLNPKIYQTY